MVTSPLLGWLPGPGGVPMFLAGMGLLAVHHDWAKRLLHYIKTNGVKVSEYIFRDHPGVQALYDILSTLLMVGGIYLLNTYTRNLTLTFSIFLLFTGLALFIGNRKRLATFTHRIKTLFR